MNIPTLLFVEEFENTLVNKVLSRKDIKLVLLRFKQSNFFTKEHLDNTSNVLVFVLDKSKPMDIEVKRFKAFCLKKSIKITHFYNDSEFNQEGVQKFANLAGLDGALSHYQSLLVRDKGVMKDMLMEIGYKTMQYKSLLSQEDAFSFPENHGGFPFIVKWRKGLSSKEVYCISNLEQLEALDIDYSTGRYIAERFCPHTIWCIDALVQDGKVLSTFLAWLPYSNLSFAEKKDKFAQITVSENSNEIRFDRVKIAQDIVTKVCLLNGYLHLEVFVDTQGQPIVCEFGWRSSGEYMLSNHSEAYDVDVYSLLIDIMIGKKIRPLNLLGKKSVGDMFLPMESGVIKKISTLDSLLILPGVINGDLYYKEGDSMVSKRQYTSSAGWLQVEGDSKEQVLERMLYVYDNFEIIIT